MENTFRESAESLNRGSGPERERVRPGETVWAWRRKEALEEGERDALKENREGL